MNKMLWLANFSVVQLWNYSKAIIRLRLGEYCRTIWQIIVNFNISNDNYIGDDDDSSNINQEVLVTAMIV